MWLLTVSRFETEILTQKQNIDALATLNSTWVSRAVSRSEAKKVILDIDSSESPGEYESRVPERRESR